MKIYKYPLPSFDCIIEMPRNAEIKYVGNQNGNIVLWAMINELDEISKRCFKVFPTGANIDTGNYIGTVLQVGGAFVWHVFEIV